MLVYETYNSSYDEFLMQAFYFGPNMDTRGLEVGSGTWWPDCGTFAYAFAGFSPDDSVAIWAAPDSCGGPMGWGFSWEIVNMCSNFSSSGTCTSTRDLRSGSWTPTGGGSPHASIDVNTVTSFSYDDDIIPPPSSGIEVEPDDEDPNEPY
jgi:hypothetical protein